MKPIGTPSTKKCPECGGDTVIETRSDMFGTRKIRRCDNLIETSPSQPLEACLWDEEIYRNGKVKPLGKLW